MKPDKWQEIKEKVKSQFEVEYQEVEDLDPPPGTVEVIEFDGPAGYMRLEYTTKPKTVGLKVHGSKRIGGESFEEKLYSDDEEVNYMKVYTWNEDDEEWEEMEQNIFV